MRSFLFLTFLIAGALPCAHACEPQEPAALSQLRARFEAYAHPDSALAIAIVKGSEPVVLCAGTTVAGQAITPSTLLPLGPLARFLVTDALSVRHRGNLDIGSGVKIGGVEKTLRELLVGRPGLPDYWAWEGGQKVAPATLLACAEVAAALDHNYTPSVASFAEFVLLRPLLLGEDSRDWSGFLRTILAPRVPGLDPRDADALTEEELRLVPPATGRMARAEPPILRLLVSAKNIAAWWQWRMREGMPLWDGWRNGSVHVVPLRESEKRWRFQWTGPPLDTLVYAYPSKEAAILLLGSDESGRSQVVKAFEEDVFGPLKELPQPGLGVIFGRGGPHRQDLSILKDTRWVTAGGAATSLRIVVGDGKVRVLECTFGGKTWTSSNVYPNKGGFKVLLQGQPNGARILLLLWPRPDLKQPQTMRVVLIETRGKTACIPHHFVLEREKD